MLGTEIITVSSEIHTQHVNAFCLQNLLSLVVHIETTWLQNVNTNFSLLSRSEVSQMKPIDMQYTDIRHLTTGIRSEKCVVR